MTRNLMINNGRPGMQLARLAATRRPPSRAETPAAQLEIAAQWLHEAAMRLTELKHMDLSMQLTRVGHDCERMAGRV
ncbi:hypothetical protein B5M44_04275 [Shinella sumterensis]|uniref:hypothetical protein n=1 Tax=Shinella sumterensis TaxID=1967501 RepID=UPI00106EBE0F|nr:hypothetical protein [Shinella sumterensis]MCD1264042.1 hypothetical protein [Shinella sumterensis]TFE99422.1 hypothetical protein B5M44_04275 [Shinella sumterensis]